MEVTRNDQRCGIGPVICLIERTGIIECCRVQILDRADKQEFVNKVRDPLRFQVGMNTDTAGDLLVEAAGDGYDIAELFVSATLGDNVPGWNGVPYG